MNYEEMVKEAYEEILGFDKEAWSMADDPGLAAKLDAAKSMKKNIAETSAPNKDMVKLMIPESVHEAVKKSGKARLSNKQLAGIGAGALAVAGSTIAAKKLYDKHKRKQAEKAAAYYDEAQLVKEAAEADYAEACAYEEAALAILDELGYLD